jgi:hypothetical protein
MEILEYLQGTINVEILILSFLIKKLSEHFNTELYNGN